jgi:hypothetical protein
VAATSSMMMNRCCRSGLAEGFLTVCLDLSVCLSVYSAVRFHVMMGDN